MRDKGGKKTQKISMTSFMDGPYMRDLESDRDRRITFQSVKSFSKTLCIS